jgi:UDP-N-acetylglucosamine 1-carboxyvinyltransferase
VDKIRITGEANLHGSISVPGSKNAALPIIVSSLLSFKDLTLSNVPDLEDIKSMIMLLRSFGVAYSSQNNKLTLNAGNIKNNIADYDLVRKMRASILVLGPLLARFKKAKISLPGGCAIGTRPIDIHLDALSKLGIKFEIANGFVSGEVIDKLTGNIVDLPFPSVGATENLMMASSLAEGITIINNPAREPEITDLQNSLNSMGAKISGSGSNCIRIKGVVSLNPGNHIIMSDRIVAGTFILAAVMINKNFKVENFNPKHLTSLITVLKNMNANIEITDSSIRIYPSQEIIATEIETAPYPGFPTDLQAQIMALMSLAKGKSKIVEKIFENRFMHVAELNRLGAKITIKNDTAYIQGGIEFKGAQVMASDLRASVSLILAALCAKGDTVIHRVYHLDRGYEKIEETLGKCGPLMTREK